MTWSIKWNVSGFVEKRLQQVEREMKISGVNIVSDVKQRMSQPGTGRIYKSRGAPKGSRAEPIFGGKRHQASAPGHPPAVDIGELRRGVAWRIRRVLGNVILDVGVRGKTLQERAEYLEDPDVHNRPAFVPALEAEKPRLRARLRKGGVR